MVQLKKILQEVTTEKLAFFSCKCLLMYYFTFKNVPWMWQHQPDQWNIHVEKKYFIIKCVEDTSRKDGESQNAWRKKDNKISDIFYKMQNFLRKSRASIIITSPIKIFISGSLVHKLIPTFPTVPTIPTTWDCSRYIPYSFPRHLENSNLFILNYY